MHSPNSRTKLVFEKNYLMHIFVKKNLHLKKFEQNQSHPRAKQCPQYPDKFSKNILSKKKILDT